MFDVLRTDDDDDLENDYLSRSYYDNDDVNKEKFTCKEVDILYKYFVDEGLSNKKQVRCHPQNWRINKEHICASLRRHNGNINEAGKDLSDLLKNENFDIRTFYAKFNTYEEFESSKNHPYYIKPYLSGQEWQLKPESGLYLLNDNIIYKISYVSFEYGFITLDKVLTRKYNEKKVKFDNDDVRCGNYKQIKYEDITKYLEKEYQIICDEFKEISKKQEIWLSEKFKNRSDLVTEIENLKEYHKNNCTTNAKLNIIGKLNLPINVITKIVSYNIDSKCDHYWKIRDLEDRINYLDYIIDEDYLPYNELKWKREVAYHVLCNDYDEWLNDYY
jgi:hypothetical protein